MGLGDLFKATENQELKNKVREQENRISELEGLFTPEMTDLYNIKKRLDETQQELSSVLCSVEEAQHQLAELHSEISEKKQRIIETDERLLLQEFGLYEPVYDLANSDEYKIRLDSIRESQKNLIKGGQAATGSTSWLVNNDAAKGRKMIKDMQKLLLRAFNDECDAAISKVKFSNFDASRKRITVAKDSISKLGTMMAISISEEYYYYKIQELHLAYEYQVKKQEEKEEQKRIREELREQAKLEKEIENARKEIDKEKQHYTNALSKITDQLSTADEEHRPLLEQKKAEIENQLVELDKSLSQIDYRAANQKAGYVYIISNIGSFGEGIYKIGMTRRLEPLDRVSELGDASVPFNFDVHALIFSDDAPKLEAALHRAFEDRKLNMINTRREFFRVTLEEIEAVVKENYDKTVEFVKLPDAEQYRQSLKMREASAPSSLAG